MDKRRKTNLGREHLDYLFYDPEWKPPKMIYGDNLLPEFTRNEGEYVVSTM